MEPISIDDFKKVDIRVGEIVSAESIEGSDKLLKLKVHFGDHDRQVLSGIAKYFPDPGSLVGKRCAFVVNLAPRVMMGLESQAMILATDSTGSPQAGKEEKLYLFESQAPAGAQAH